MPTLAPGVYRRRSARPRRRRRVFTPAGVGVSSLVAGAASFVSSSPTAISVSATAPSGGSGSLSYQWERNADGGSYSDLSGATSLSLTDSTATAGTLYGYRCKQTRGAETVTTSPVTAQIYTGGALVGGGGLTLAELQAELTTRGVTSAALAYLDAAVSSRLAPAGTLAAVTTVGTVNGLASNVITAASVATDAFTASKFAADVTTELQSGLATASALTTLATTVGTAGAGLTAITSKTNSLTFTNANQLDAYIVGFAPALATAGTATAGGASTITLAVGSSAVNDFYVPRLINLVGGTGADQSRRITAYVGSTRVATVDSPWATAPDSTTQYQLRDASPPASGSLGTNAPAGWINAAALATDTLTAAKFAADVTTELQAGLATASALSTLSTSVAALPTASANATAVWAAGTRTITGTVTLAAATHTGAVIPTVTTLTGHTPQTGDSFARIGATGSGLTSLASATAATAIQAKTALIPTSPAAVGDVPTAAQTAAAVWNEAQSSHTTAGTFGKYLDAAVSGVSTGGLSASDIATAVWATGTRTITGTVTLAAATHTGAVIPTVNTVASTINLTNLPAITTDWITAAGVSAAAVTKIQTGLTTGDTAGTTTLLSRLTSSRASGLDNLDAAITTRAAASTALSNDVWTTPKAGYLDSPISGVSTGGVSTADIAAAVRDVSNASPAPDSLGAAVNTAAAGGGGGGGGATAEQVAAAILATPANKLATDASGRVTGAADVLDAVPTTLNAAPSTVPQWVMWLVLRFRRTRRVKSTGILSVYGSNGSSVITNQVTTTNSTESTVGAVQ